MAASVGVETGQKQPSENVPDRSDGGDNTERTASSRVRNSSAPSAQIDLSFITPNPHAPFFQRPDLDKPDYAPFAITGTVPAEGESRNDHLARDQIARAEAVLGRPLKDNEKNIILAHYRNRISHRHHRLYSRQQQGQPPRPLAPNPRGRTSATAADIDLSFISPNPGAPLFLRPDMDDPSYAPFAATGTVPAEGETVNDLRVRDQIARSEAQLGRPLKDGERATIVAYFRRLDEKRPTPDEVARNIPESVNNPAGNLPQQQQQQQQQKQQHGKAKEKERGRIPALKKMTDLVLHPSSPGDHGRARAGERVATALTASTGNMERGSGPGHSSQRQRQQGQQEQQGHQRHQGRQGQSGGRERRASPTAAGFDRLLPGGQTLAEMAAELLHRVGALEDEVGALKLKGGYAAPPPPPLPPLPDLFRGGGWASWLAVLAMLLTFAWSLTEAMLRSWMMGRGYEGWVNGGFNGLGTVLVFGGWAAVWSYTVSVVVLGYFGISGVVSVTVAWGRRASTARS
ncbi:hypothetical protein VTJ83DRAFT_7445 [Remersonia thermophila]|uniref:Uncharacterized protein n=1 Tax=Remersonia thermophila TaxID=72144 RepID=A0ABR4D3N3_9PEZI